ncbi:MAG: D-aminoacyl-tRNA deacylase [Candidatus Micrarchaeota archaeon]
MPLIVCSKKQELGLKTFSLLKEKKANVVLIEDSPLNLTSIPQETDLLVFCSTHKSVTSSPCFTTHAPGNFTDALHGGEPRALAFSSGTAIRNAFTFFQKQNLLPSVMEATHHGPTSLNKPCVFVELGSTVKEWSDGALCEFLTEACIHVAETHLPAETSAIGFGGTHYCSAFLKLALKQPFSFICPKHALASLDEVMLRQMIEKSVERVDKAFIDKKGCASEARKKLLVLLEKASLNYEFV